jgi:hypothetical protein
MFGKISDSACVTKKKDENKGYEHYHQNEQEQYHEGNLNQGEQIAETLGF